MIDIFSLPVHAVTEFWPMMSDTELEDLAADIKAKGLQSGVTLDATGETLIDGRNRREACRRIGVTPSYDILDKGVDIVGFIVSTNKRRDLTVEQKAFIAARIANLPQGRPLIKGPREPFSQPIDIVQSSRQASLQALDIINSQGKPPISLRDAGELMGVSRQSVKRAAKVIKSGVPELEVAVKQGEITLSKAYNISGFTEENQITAIEKEKEPPPVQRWPCIPANLKEVFLNKDQHKTIDAINRYFKDRRSQRILITMLEEQWTWMKRS